MPEDTYTGWEGWEHIPTPEDGYCFDCDSNPCECGDYDPMLDWEDTNVF